MFKEASRKREKTNEMQNKKDNLSSKEKSDSKDAMLNKKIESFNHFKTAAEQGDADAQYNLALMYIEGEVTAINTDESIRWLETAADQGHEKSKTILELLYLEGKYHYSDESENKIRQWLIEELEQERSYLQKAEGSEEEQKEAFEWFKTNARKGNIEAQCMLGKMYFEGKGTAKNQKEGARWFKSAAEQGHEEAQIRLAMIYYNGEGVKRSEISADKWLKVAAEKGNKDVKYLVGQLYGKASRISCHQEKAYYYYWFAAIMGNEDAKSLIENLKRMYAALDLDSLFSSSNYEEFQREAAFGWYKVAEGEGDCESQYRLAWMYDKGCGTEKNTEEAFRLYKEAAERGHIEAQYHLGQMYDSGPPENRNKEESIRWYKNAAEKGHKDAANELAIIYACDNNEEERRKWHQKAVENGFEYNDAKTIETKPIWLQLLLFCLSLIACGATGFFSFKLTGRLDLTVWTAVLSGLLVMDTIPTLKLLLYVRRGFNFVLCAFFGFMINTATEHHYELIQTKVRFIPLILAAVILLVVGLYLIEICEKANYNHFMCLFIIIIINLFTSSFALLIVKLFSIGFILEILPFLVILHVLVSWILCCTVELQNE